MSTVTYYNEDGRLLEWWIYTNDASKDLNTDGKLFIAGQHDGETHYVSSSEVVARPASPVTVDGTTLLDVPANSTIHIDDEVYSSVSSGDVEMSFPLSGTYRVRVACFPYLDFDAEVTVA